MLRRLELPESVYPRLRARADGQGIGFMSTPFDEGSADFLDALSMEAFKIGSGELTHHDFLRHVAGKRKPVILSTGMASLDEVREALRVIVEAGNSDVVLLHCVSDYPADPSEMNLRAMTTMSSALQCPVGLSDHTMGIEISLAAVALGARVVEKHLTLDRTMAEPDHRASLEPREMTALVDGIRKVEAALGDGRKRPTVREVGVAAVARRSLVVAMDLPAGAILTAEALMARRPGSGISPVLKPALVGRRLRVPVAAGTLLTMEMLA
jgi:sialic acid synthase SpsE